MRADDVATYLKDHPEFFEHYADFLSQLHIPSPHGGRAVSITERQMATLREKVKQLEGKLAELISFGNENDAIAIKLHRLSVALMGASDFPAVLRALYSHLGGAFAVPHVVLRVWGVGFGSEPEFLPVVDSIKAFAGAASHPYCGTATGQETVAWLGELGGHVRSVAQIPLRDDGACFGLLLLASEEPHRFYAEMGTMYLEQIGDLASAALLRVVG